MKKRWLALAVALVLTAVPFALSSSAAEPGVVFADSIDIIADNTTIGVLNPFAAASNTSPTMWTFTMIYDRLLELDHETGRSLPALAKSWKTDDFKTFIFDLRDDVYFHNGEKFTADDVIYTVNLSRKIGTGSQGAAQWALVDTMRAIGPYTLEIVLTSVFVDFYFNLQMPSAAIVNQKAVEGDPEKGLWIGTGAYRVVEFDPSNYVRLERNDNYWNKEKNIVTKNVTLRFIPEMSARTVRVQVGESQLSFGTSTEDLDLFRADSDNYEVLPQRFNAISCMSFNMNDPLLADYNLRMAFFHGINREEVMIFGAGEGGGVPATDGTLWGSWVPYRNTDIPMTKFDPELAKEFLKKSAYKGEVISIAAAVSTSIRMSQAIQYQMQQIGVNIRVNEMDTPSLQALMVNPDGGSQIIVNTINMSLSPFSVRNILYPGGAQNRMFYNNPVITQMLDDILTMTNEADRERTFKEIQRLFAEDAVVNFLYFRLNSVVAAKGIGGVFLAGDAPLNDLREIFMVVK